MNDQELGSSSSEERLIFVSHRHEDARIADCISTFIRSTSAARVNIFNSSSVDQKGPRLGQDIPSELKKALASCGVVILVYTDPSTNWQWCLWECGVSLDPLDSTPTRVIVFSFCEEVPGPYQSDLIVNVAGSPATSNDTAESEERERPGTFADDLKKKKESVVLVERFVQEFCKDPDFFPDGRGAVAPEFTDSEIRMKAQTFQAELANLIPPDGNNVDQQIAMAARELSITVRRERLLPLVENAVRALGWGTSEAPHKDFFDAYWNETCGYDMERLAKMQVVFRSPRGVTQWEKLLELAKSRIPKDLTQPWIRLVSGEVSTDAIAFWKDAMSNGTHANSYEQPVRLVAQDHLASDQNRNCVERRFLFDANYFMDHQEDIEPFKAVIDWMINAGITVSVARIADAGDAKWKDFGLVGDLAVSRFVDLGRIEYRTLIENFERKEIQAANQKWQALVPQWSSSGTKSFADYINSSI